MSQANQASANQRRLRVGVIVNPCKIFNQVHYALKQIYESKAFHLAAVVEITPRQGSPAQEEDGLECTPASVRWWYALDRRLFQGRTRVPSAHESARPLTNQISGDAAFVHLEPGHLAGEEIEQLKAADLDVLLDFSCSNQAGQFAPFARYGVWSVGHPRHILSRVCRAMYDHAAAIDARICIQRLGSSAVAQGHWFALDHSLYRNYNTSCWKATALLLDLLSDLQREGWPGIQPRVRPVKDQALDTRLPGVTPLVLFLIGHLFGVLYAFAARSIFLTQWFVAFRDTSERSGCFKALLPPRDRFYADPFVFERNGMTYLFFEQCPFNTNKGVIACAKLEADGRLSAPEVVLDRPYHLSFPSLFEWKGEVYLLPETAENDRVELYRSVDFPHRWQLDRVLIDGVHALDPTIVQYLGKFWLFAGLAAHDPSGSGDEQLAVFFSNTPLGPWTAHPKNPVIADVRDCRPAGELFIKNGQLVRPAQDCSTRYGYAVCLNRVDVLSETEYRETRIDVIRPDWFPHNQSTHTFNQSKGFQVLDGSIRISRFLPRWMFRSDQIVTKSTHTIPSIDLSLDLLTSGAGPEMNRLQSGPHTTTIQ